jgi:hypothetical protein
MIEEQKVGVGMWPKWANILGPILRKLFSRLQQRCSAASLQAPLSLRYHCIDH